MSCCDIYKTSMLLQLLELHPASLLLLFSVTESSKCVNSYLSTLFEGLDRDGCARELIIEKFSTPLEVEANNIQIILMIKD